MKIRVLFFAAARDAAGTGQLELEVDPSATVGSLRERLPEIFPGLAPVLASSAFAVDEEYVRDGARLHDGAEVGLIPPVSGG